MLSRQDAARYPLHHSFRFLSTVNGDYPHRKPVSSESRTVCLCVYFATTPVDRYDSIFLTPSDRLASNKSRGGLTLLPIHIQNLHLFWTPTQLS